MAVSWLNLIFTLNMGVLCLMLPAGQGLAEILSNPEPVRNGFSLDAVRAATDDTVITLQYETDQLNLQPNEYLLGTYGLTVQEIIKELAPHLEDATPILAEVQAIGDAVHERWEFSYQGIPLYKTSVQMHFNKNKLMMLRTSLPAIRLIREEVSAFEFISPEKLGFITSSSEKRIIKKVLANSGGLLAPAWSMTTQNTATDIVREVLIDARNGAILEDHDQGELQLAQVYEKGPADPGTIEAALPYLGGDGYLDGKFFSVFAPDIQSPRVQDPENIFNYNPADFADSLNFDQVQAYYSANTALDWFRNKLDLTFPETQIPVRVNDLVKGKADNALYVFPPFGPEIKIGKGTAAIRNLARDTDVMFHEFSHHIVYRFLKTIEGESAILHEGYADYFAYAINGDPYLGESVVEGQPYLRTAKLDVDVRYDNLDSKDGKHAAGQIWSAVLWQIHEDLGMAAEKLVYSSLPYLGTSGGFKDALLALLNADRDLNPLATTDPEYEIYGTNKCIILAAAVDRGFATFIENLDAATCNMNLTDLAQASRNYYNDKNRVKTKGDGATLTAFGRKCSSIGALGRGSSWPVTISFLSPLIFLMFNRLSGTGVIHGSGKNT